MIPSIEREYRKEVKTKGGIHDFREELKPNKIAKSREEQK
jgi:hypothetical protein